MEPTANDLTGYKTRADEALSAASSLEAGAPALLGELRKNLVSVFSKDNPLIQKREQLLGDFLSTGARSRAEMLPRNLPTVAGSPLNLSPTQQAAIESGRSSAAFAPLASINQLITGEYGNLADILSNAATMQQAQIGAAKTRASGLMELYRLTLAEEEEKRQRAQSGGNDLLTQLAALGLLPGGHVQGAKTEFIGPPGPPPGYDIYQQLREEEESEAQTYGIPTNLANDPLIGPIALANAKKQKEREFLESLSGLSLEGTKPSTPTSLSIAGIPSQFSNTLKNLGIDFRL